MFNFTIENIFPRFNVPYKPLDIIDPIFLRNRFTPEHKRGGTKPGDIKKIRARKAQRDARKNQRKHRK